MLKLSLGCYIIAWGNLLEKVGNLMELLKLIADIRSPALDTVVGLITRLGEETVGVVFLCLILWCISKKVAYGIGIAFFLSSLTVQGMKVIFRIERPWVIDPTFTPVEGAIEYATGYSFPSGHTQTAASLYWAIGAQVRNKPVKAICFIIPILVAFSRMYLGVHTLLDVVVSLLISFLLVLLTVKALTSDDASKKRDFAISLAMVLFSFAVIVVSVTLYANGTIEAHYVRDCLIAGGACIGFAVGMFIERVFIKFSVKSKNIAIHIIKFIIGIAGVIAIQEGLKLISTSLAFDMFRYFMMLMWVTAFYPLIIKRFFSAGDLRTASGQ